MTFPEKGGAAPRVGNRLLASLPPHELEIIQPKLEPMALNVGDILYEPGGTMSHVYFPLLGVVSIVALLSDGSSVEMTTVGNEGVVGLQVFLGQTIATSRAMVQVSDGGLRIERKRFVDLLPRLPTLRARLGDYAASLLDVFGQSAACNARHSLEQRAARWLLMTDDRMESQPFNLTHEFLAQMLGVARPGVTLAARALSQAGLIRYTRGHVRVTDRGGLEEVACECYVIIRDRLSAVYA